VTREQWLQIALVRDKSLLEHMQKAYVCYCLLAILDPDPWERMYYRRLTVTAQETIASLERKMVRRYL
jgi:hypothetical protein